MDGEELPQEEISDSLHELLLGLNATMPEQGTSSSQWHTLTPMTQPSYRNNTSESCQSPPTTQSSRSTSRPRAVQARRTFSSLQDAASGAGEPTSSVSVNTAQASLSTAMSSNSSRPLAALTNASINKRSNIRPMEMLSPTTLVPPRISGYTVLSTEKEVDDPTMMASGNSLDPTPGSTSQRLSNLFVSNDMPTPGALSRGVTQIRSPSHLNRTTNDEATLNGHLFHNGFLGGRHSDITIHAFGQSYKLHKIILDRAPFFSSAFCGPWAESSASEMTLLPEELDANITRTAFELALKRLYGTVIIAQEEQSATGLFATACWLDMPDLVDSCVDYILKQMQPSKLHILINLVTKSYYGKAGDRILSSAKAMLCREGGEMPYEYWDGIPAEIIREIIGGDPFYIPGEWERWFLALKLLNRRLRRLAVENGLVSADGRYVHSKPQSLRFFAIRFDTIYRRENGYGHMQHWSEKEDAWCTLYTSQEVSPILVLLDEGIHYVHLRFEQLQQIRTARDILGVPVLPEKVISDALWMSMELRQRVLNAHEGDVELNLSEEMEEYEDAEEVIPSVNKDSIKGKQREGSDSEAPKTEMESGSWDGNGRPRKFWIPTTDVSCIMGGAREAMINTVSATNSGDWSSSATRLSSSLEPADVAWAADFAGSLFESNSGSRNQTTQSPPRFSHYPPFRFSAEFPNPRTLKEKKRVYSQTVWYAGSMWNLYIQRVNTTKNQQLGIYLHRAKDKDPSDDPLAQFIPATVDDRIGQLEREMLLRKTERRNRQWRAEVGTSGGEADHEDISSGHEYDTPDHLNTTTTNNTERFADPDRDRDHHASARKTSQTPAVTTHTLPRPSHKRTLSSTSALHDSDDSDVLLLRTNQRYTNASLSTMPPYIDARSTIKTYFKIYSPSKAGRLLSVYESAPDSFNFGKSWGWKSSQMVLDDGLGGYEKGGAKDGKLRYMVVIGNV